MPFPTIASPQNDKIKRVRALQSTPKARRREGRIVLEGARLIGDALNAGAQPDFALYTSDAAESDRPTAPLIADLVRRGVPCYPTLPAVFAHAAETQSPQGLIAVVAPPTRPLPSAPTFLIALDGVAEPGNLGTIFRAAAAAGAEGVILAPNCVDPYNPKALRAGMGAHFRVAHAALTWDEIAVRCAGLTVYLADADGGQPYTRTDWRSPFMLIIGGEARGAESAAGVAALRAQVVSIPMANATESLNAAMAASILMFKAAEQRAGA